MKVIIVLAALVCFAVALGDSCEAGDEQVSPMARHNVYCVTLSDGSALSICTSLQSSQRRHNARVTASLCSASVDGEGAVSWTADVTSLDYVPGADCYYALVKAGEDHLFIFATWNDHYCTIDKRTGRLLKKGEGDDVLKQYNSFVPLKLRINAPSTFGLVKGPEAIREIKQDLEMTRRESVFLYSQAIPASKLKRFYVVQFGEPLSSRAPMFVVVWKGTTFGSFCTNMEINGHSVRPVSTSKAIYVLQPDYSLQRLRLSEEEITRLLSHVTRNQVRIDDRVASLVERQDIETLSRQDPAWLEKLRSEQELLPPDPYWEKKVDPYLKVVEPSQTEAK
jgi:hypothetical protein